MLVVNSRLCILYWHAGNVRKYVQKPHSVKCNSSPSFYLIRALNFCLPFPFALLLFILFFALVMLVSHRTTLTTYSFILSLFHFFLILFFSRSVRIYIIVHVCSCRYIYVFYFFSLLGISMEVACIAHCDVPNWLRAWMISNFIMGYDINGVKIQQPKLWRRQKKGRTEMELTPEHIRPLKKGGSKQRWNEQRYWTRQTEFELANTHAHAHRNISVSIWLDVSCAGAMTIRITMGFCKAKTSA